MFKIVHNILWGVKEAKRHEFPKGEVHFMQIRKIVDAMEVDDFIICPNYKQAQRIHARLKKLGHQSTMRTVREKRKTVVKLWRLT